MRISKSNKVSVKASKTYHFYRHNGESYTTEPDGTKVLSRKVLERNVLDMLEDNDKYMNLDFCDAEVITEEATPEELLAIYDEEMTPEEFEALYNRIFGVQACGDIKASKKLSANEQALTHIKAAIDILGKSGNKDEVTKDTIANLGVVMLDLKGSK